MKQFQLSELENQKLQNASLRAQMAQMQGQQAQERYDAAMAESKQFMEEFCKRVGQDVTKVVNADPKSGMVFFAEEGDQPVPAPAPEAKPETAQDKVVGNIKPKGKK